MLFAFAVYRRLLRERRIVRLCRALLLSLVFLLVQPASAGNVVAVLSEDSQPYRETVEAIKAVLEQASPAHHFTWGTLQASNLPPLRDADLVVTVGLQATQSLLESQSRVPLLATLVPKQSFDRLLARQRDSRAISSIYLDQPISRQVALFRIGVPGRKKLGVILGPESQEKLKGLQASTREQKVQLISEKIDSPDELIPALQRVLGEADALLALPDQLVFNKNNVHSVLLTSYRYQDPVIGYSQAYVKAGALLGVYSRPGQIGQQAGELILRALESKAGLPQPQYPKYFSVSVNQQVARSLGVQMEDELGLTEKLKRAVESEP